MNIEVEIKMEVKNFDEIKEKVSKIGKLIKSIKQVDDYYVPHHRDFFARKPAEEFLRIRTNPDKTVFEYTRVVNMREDGSNDYAEEYETEIKEVEEFRKTLEFLDFRKVVTVEKQREYWLCGGIEVALDKISNLGDFIEAEAKGDFKSEAEAKRACFDVLKNLGITNIENDFVKKGYPELVLEKDK
jgi:predicted adenylyl cyclase CyaB